MTHLKGEEKDEREEDGREGWNEGQRIKKETDCRKD
jgi:hypothetical protein